MSQLKLHNDIQNLEKARMKKKNLEKYLRQLGSVAVAFSAGVDSTFLLKVAHDVLGERAVAITAQSYTLPEREKLEAMQFCREQGIVQIIAEVNELEKKEFCQNPQNRCYICKYDTFSMIKQIAMERGIPNVVEGSNVDDESDYRPGMQAIAELDIISPLRKARLYKSEIRALSKEMNLFTWDKPSFACLATRFGYGEEITQEKLSMVEKAEQYLLDLGFQQMRVRIHGKIARIEIDNQDFEKILQTDIASAINAYLKKLGFSYVSLDLGGYKQGNMNQGIIK